MRRENLHTGAYLEAKDNYGVTPLQRAAQVGHHETLVLLLEHGADVSSKNNVGATPLHIAADLDQGEAVQLLLSSGADEQSRTHDGRTPEYVATSRGHLQIVDMFKAEAVRRAQWVAFAMGQQERLGARSLVQELDPGVVRMVLEHA